MNRIYAHRGLSNIYPENSMSAIIEATKYDYIYGIEIDVRMTKDKKFVVIHDPEITLVSNGTGLVCDMTLDELYKYNFSYNSLNTKKEYLKSFVDKNGKEKRKKLKNLKNRTFKITTLESVLLAVKNKQILIEIKKGSQECFDLDKFYKLIERYKNRNIAIQSFNKDVIKWLRKKDDTLNLGILIGTVDIEEKLKMKTNFISIEHNLLNEEILKNTLKNNKEVNVWTLDTYKELKNLKSRTKENFSKIGIITNNTNLEKYL